MVDFGRVPIGSRWFRIWVALAATGVIVGTALWTIPMGGGTPSPAPPASATTASGATPGASSSNTVPTAWEPYVLPPEAPLADLVATRRDAAGVETDTAFRLTSRTTASAAQLATRLEVSPAIALRVASGADQAAAIVTPATDLTPGTSYRFRIRSESGTVAASWLFQAKQPLHVVSTIPADKATSVPVGTGIEATFDQDGVTGYQGKVAIVPAMPFKLEFHGRTLAIVPQRELAQRTLYSVTIAHGIGASGSDVTLEQDVVIRFETGGPATTGPTLLFDRTAADAAPSEAPALHVQVCCEQDSAEIQQRVEVYRLASLDAAIAAARTLATAPTWAAWSDVGLVSTAGLAAALRFEATLIPADPGSSEYVLRFPAKLAAGRYLVVMPRPGRDAQLVLQVTRLATFSEVSTTRTLAWVNDVTTGSAVAGAAVSLAGGPSLGRTGADGLLLANTPALLLKPRSPSAPPPVVVIAPPQGPAVFSLVSEDLSSRYAPDGAPAVAEDYWLAFATDRTTFRTTDTIQAWGTVRARGGKAPSSVEIRVVPGESASEASAPAVARATPALDRNGVFTASIPIVDLPLTWYRVELVVDGSVVRTLSVTVDEVRKPAYAIAVTVDRHVLVEGETFRATARAAFLDGTPVPGLELVFLQQGAGRRATTDADGRASLTLTATLSSSIQNEVWVRPIRPEEGDVEGSISLGIYPSSVWLTSDATLKGTSLSVSGRAQALAVAAMEKAWATSESPSPGGDPIAGERVGVSIVRNVQHQEETGRRYDWISKQTVPEYRTWTTEEPVTSVVRTTDADGRFALTVNVPDAAGMYAISVSAQDSKGRTATSSTSAGALVEEWVRGPYVQATSTAASGCCDGYPVGTRILYTIQDAVEPATTGAARFLYVAAQRGIRDAVVSASDRLTRTFAASDVPNVSVSAVEFTGRGVVVAWGAVARIDDASRRLKVVLTTDAKSYRPGADVRLTVRTFGPDGRPAPASVVVQAVDEKFYLMDQAWVTDPFDELYGWVSDGILWSDSTLRLPIGSAGDTTGGGSGDVVPRTDFRDTLLFRRITTDATGQASLTFRLSDDLTSWRVSAGAVDAALQAGSASTLVPVGLPFFVEATIAPELLVSDRPVLRVRAYGDAIRAGDPVRFTVAAPSLGLAGATVEGTAFAASRVTLPQLAAGSHELRISASTVGRSPALTDALVRTIRVVGSRYQVATTTYQLLDAAFKPEGGTDLTTYVISDAGRGSLLSILERLAWADGARLDQVLGSAVARDLLAEAFDRDTADLPASRFEATSYQKEGGLSLLPYGAGDLALTAQAAIAAPERFDRSWLRERVWASYGDPYSTMTRERGIVALAALAALGEPVAGELGPFAASPDLSVRERLYLGLAYASLGDDAAARSIERSLLSAFGRVSGPWLKLEGSPDRDEVAEATGLLAVLAASLGDAIADRAQAYVEANPPRTTLPALEEIAFVRRSLDRLPAEPVRFAYTVGGTRTVVDLAPGESTTLRLTATQRTTLRLEPLSGRAGVTTTSTAPAKPGDRPADPAVTVTRTVSPATTVGETQIVQVRLSVRFADTASDGCYEVVDRVPSGLAPLTGDGGGGVIAPYATAGQLVRSCVARGMESHTVGYSARVVSPGTFTWEPATVSSSEAADRVSATGTATLTIR